MHMPRQQTSPMKNEIKTSSPVMVMRWEKHKNNLVGNLVEKVKIYLYYRIDPFDLLDHSNSELTY